MSNADILNKRKRGFWAKKRPKIHAFFYFFIGFEKWKAKNAFHFSKPPIHE